MPGLVSSVLYSLVRLSLSFLVFPYHPTAYPLLGAATPNPLAPLQNFPGLACCDNSGASLPRKRLALQQRKSGLRWKNARRSMTRSPCRSLGVLLSPHPLR